MTRICSKCGSEHEWAQRGHGSLCQNCWNAYHREWSARNRNKPKLAAWARRNYAKLKEEDPERLMIYRRTQRLKRFGTTLEWYEGKLSEQKNLCAICGMSEKVNRSKKAGGIDNLAIDHDHKCCDTYWPEKTCGKCNRGLLCSQCNMTLGMIERGWLEKAQAYLKLYSKEK